MTPYIDRDKTHLTNFKLNEIKGKKDPKQVKRFRENMVSGAFHKINGEVDLTIVKHDAND